MNTHGMKKDTVILDEHNKYNSPRYGGTLMSPERLAVLPFRREEARGGEGQGARRMANYRVENK